MVDPLMEVKDREVQTRSHAHALREFDRISVKVEVVEAISILAVM